MAAYDKFIAVQTQAAALIQADPFFAGIEVLTERMGDVNQKIQSALGRIGLSVIVLTPRFELSAKKGKRRVVTVKVVVDCSEIVVTNMSAAGTQKPALAAAWAAALALDKQPNGLDPAGAVHLSGAREFALLPGAVAQVPHKELPALITYQAYLETVVTV